MLFIVTLSLISFPCKKINWLFAISARDAKRYILQFFVKLCLTYIDGCGNPHCDILYCLIAGHQKLLIHDI